LLFFHHNYFCQKDGKNRTSIANNSSLPKIIPKLNTHFEKSGNCEKLPFGPIIVPKPGPTLEIEVAAAEIDVTKSRPFKDNNAVIKKNIIIYKYINEIIEDINLSSTLLPSYLIKKIPLG